MDKRKAIKGCLILSLLAITSLEFVNKLSGQTTAVDDDSLDLSSIDLKTSRTTELGKPVLSQNKDKKELPVLMNDPAFAQAWGLKATDADKAWRVTTGSRSIIVAIIDTGIDVRHPALAANIWTNQGETGVDKNNKNKATNGIDDDGNGYIDDVHGWNFVSNNNDLTDNHGHGTHIAGIIGATGGKNIPVAGISPKVSLMALKYYDPKAAGFNNLLNTVKAIQYAVRNGANIINYSGGGVEPSPQERQAIEMANRQNILFVAAAGNERANSDLKAYYPADYDLPNVISVTAIDKFKSVLPTSNYGEKSVDIAAPGNEIRNTLPNGQYGKMTGTSQATAFVSGVAALVMANNPELKKADRIVKYLTQTGDTVAELSGKTRYRKVLNSYKALAMQDHDLSINGVRAENTMHMNGDAFSNEGQRRTANDGPATPESQMAMFGSALNKALKMEQIPEAPSATVTNNKN